MTAIPTFAFSALSGPPEILTLLLFFVAPGILAFRIFRGQTKTVRVVTFLSSVFFGWAGFLVSLFIVTVTEERFRRN